MLVLLAALCCTVPLRAEAEQVGAKPDLKLTQKETKVETKVGNLVVATTYRGDAIILKKATPPDESKNTVYYVYLNGSEILTYKVGPMGTELSGAGMSRKLIKPDYTIKMAGDKEGRIQRITIYSPDFKKTYDGFWLKDGELIPWSSDELANWRKMRNETPNRVGGGV